MNFIEVNASPSIRILINVKKITWIEECKNGKCTIIADCTIECIDTYEDVLRTLNMINEKEGQEGKVNITKINDLYVDDIESNETLNEE